MAFDWVVDKLLVGIFGSVDMNSKVRQYWHHNEGWNWVVLDGDLLLEVLHMIASLSLSNYNGDLDVWVWKHDVSGSYLVKIGYKALSG